MYESCKKKKKGCVTIVGGKSQWKLYLSGPNAEFNRQVLQNCYFKYVKKKTKETMFKEFEENIIKVT